MPTCKDCIHYEPCKDSYYNAEQLSRFPLGFLEKENAEKNCAFFKDRSKFVELQCKPGDIVYHYCDELHEILEYTIYCVNVFREKAITYQADAYDEENDEALSEIGFETEDIGRDVFLTRKEAEQALKEREKEWNHKKLLTT